MTAHEQGAAHAADGYARATGKNRPWFFATSGPGSTNLVTGHPRRVYGFHSDGGLTATFPTAFWDTTASGSLHRGHHHAHTKHNFVVRRVEDLAADARGLRIANSGRCGPVLVDVPKDVTAALYEYTPAPPVSVRRESQCATRDRPDRRAHQRRERPVIMFGGGVIGSSATEPLHELVHKA